MRTWYLNLFTGVPVQLEEVPLQHHVAIEAPFRFDVCNYEQKQWEAWAVEQNRNVLIEAVPFSEEMVDKIKAYQLISKVKI